MMYIARPLDGYLLLVQYDPAEASADVGEISPGNPGYQGKALTYAIPDPAFWAWLRSSGYEAQLEAEDPERMARVRANGVGVLRVNKQCLIDAGFATLEECKNKRPGDGKIEIAKLEAELKPR